MKKLLCKFFGHHYKFERTITHVLGMPVRERDPVRTMYVCERCNRPMVI